MSEEGDASGTVMKFIKQMEVDISIVHDEKSDRLLIVCPKMA